MSELRPFHLAIPVQDIESCRKFYRDVIGCKEGRSSDHWVDFDFFGHQLVIHLSDEERQGKTKPVDGKDVPVPHFGIVLSMGHFEHLAAHLREQKVQFVIEPYIRFEGLAGEQATMFNYDPSENALEIKALKYIDHLFAV